MDKEYRIGQFRKTSVKEYLTDLSFDLKDKKTIGNYSGAVTFIDKQIILNPSNILQPNNSYYLNFTVFRSIDTDQTIIVYLKNSTEEDGDQQIIHTYTIEQGVYGNGVPIELIINPMNTFDTIVFELQRIADDYSQSNPDGSHGRKIEIQVTHLSKVKNILDVLGVKSLARIGVQGPPGLLMSINGEEIRIGKSGIYEMTYNVVIDFIGFIIKDNIENQQGQDYFIMDYQY